MVEGTAALLNLSASRVVALCTIDWIALLVFSVDARARVRSRLPVGSAPSSKGMLTALVVLAILDGIMGGAGVAS